MGRLSDALKALFGSNKTTGTYVPLVTSNGTPDGNITMANLATIMKGNFKVFDTTNASISSSEDIANEVLTYVRDHYTDSKVLFYGTVQAQAGSRFVYGMLYSSNYNYGTINVEMYNGTKAFYKVQNGVISLVS